MHSHIHRGEIIVKPNCTHLKIARLIRTETTRSLGSTEIVVAEGELQRAGANHCMKNILRPTTCNAEQV